jgi:hypothetical protein
MNRADGRLDHLRASLPTHDFMYSLDQIASILAISESTLNKYVLRIGRQPFTNRDMLKVVNIALEPGDRPIWRVSEREFVRWCHRRGVRLERRTDQNK